MAPNGRSGRNNETTKPADRSAGGKRGQVDNRAEGRRPVVDRIQHLPDIPRRNEVFGDDSTFGGDVVDEVVVADVIGVTVGGEQQQALRVDEFVHCAPQRLAECLGDAGVDDHNGVTGSVEDGVGEVGLFRVDVEFLTLHQQCSLVDAVHLSQRRCRSCGAGIVSVMSDERSSAGSGIRTGHARCPRPSGVRFVATAETGCGHVGDHRRVLGSSRMICIGRRG